MCNSGAGESIEGLLHRLPQSVGLTPEFCVACYRGLVIALYTGVNLPKPDLSLLFHAFAHNFCK